MLVVLIEYQQRRIGSVSLSPVFLAERNKEGPCFDMRYQRIGNLEFLPERRAGEHVAAFVKNNFGLVALGSGAIGFIDFPVSGGLCGYFVKHNPRLFLRLCIFAPDLLEIFSETFAIIRPPPAVKLTERKFLPWSQHNRLPREYSF